MKRTLSGALFMGALSLSSCYKSGITSGENKPVAAGKSTTAAAGLTDLAVSLGANAWLTQPAAGGGEVVASYGLANWTSTGAVFSAYFRTSVTGTLHLAMRAKVPSGSSQLKITAAGQSQTITASGSTYQTVDIGDFNVTDTGYVKVDFQGVTRTGGYFADVSDLYISGAATSGRLHYIQNDVYWGRRGPSVHLGYTPPAGKNIAWFYNEVTIPTGQDPIGSYFMSNGFSQGYFGIQVNSSTERRVLFSVWSPANTDDPNSIPDSLKIELLRKGPNVVSGSFGNEGAGGQSYLVYNWQAGNTYRFLTKAEPVAQNKTIFTSWFYAPETGSWQLIASFKRPQTNTYLTGLYSFLENFSTDTGFKGRKGQYGNQWVCDTNGNWYELTTAKFTGDATATAQSRMDFAGGVENNRFYLRNCGFFAGFLKLNTPLSRTASGTAPVINFNQLP
ncbi:DUF3472 domain-containing protein [Chitinophaga nivalis]|uniref:DUF3472 domain-containing protein n=1 Tax=Chitinophaga nivalis TaxID=2991709 RepID=A0ABT3ILX7_9BACT|nr:DUF3472 domain-containing protein [Chitinophaga nivalis]MCW3465343.1 DUF3472 domain-containing protein [Chitinophaga nivalis]MCW3484965.1 DUF3472 domain-containing protein [Chitinophaga nivalis]